MGERGAGVGTVERGGAEGLGRRADGAGKKFVREEEGCEEKGESVPASERRKLRAGILSRGTACDCW